MKNTLRKKLCPKDSVPLKIGEKHFMCMNYMGPGTKVEEKVASNVKPVTPSDAASQRHDLDYNQIAKDLKSGKITKKEANVQVRKADLKMIKYLREHNKDNKSALDYMSHFAARNGILTKMTLEDINILKREKFVS